MLDTSASMTGNLKLLEQAAEQFLLRMLPKDKGMVGAFNDKIEFFPATFTSDRDTLDSRRSASSISATRPVSTTRSPRAWTGSTRSTAGASSSSSPTATTRQPRRQRQVLEQARREEVMIYAVGLRSDYFNGSRQVRSKPDSGLRRLAEETGGGYFELDKTSDLAPTFTRVAQELHSQYVLGFTPTVLDGKIHRISRQGEAPA